MTFKKFEFTTSSFATPRSSINTIKNKIDIDRLHQLTQIIPPLRWRGNIR